ncbi:MAG: hypothetical protein MZV63_37535 [Marinilabiliales bacterium]|nr:hypothetical protein [Marinilabiliales bacterium]
MPTSTRGTIELAPNLRWKGIIPLVKLTERRTGLKTRITNDANAAALWRDDLRRGEGDEALHHPDPGHRSRQRYRR